MVTNVLVSKSIASPAPEILAVTEDLLGDVVASVAGVAVLNIETSERIAMKRIFFIMLKF
jgi:hypothetical protein